MTATVPARPTPPLSWPAPTGPGTRIESLWATDLPAGEALIRGGTLPKALRARFGARLAFPLRPDRPTIVANFVSTLDGIVALDRAGATGGREISGGSEPDRFLMGLLRASADAVLVGAGTARASRNHAWTPACAYPPAAREFEDWRRDLRLAPDGPTTVVVSAAGDLDARQLGLADVGPPVLVATTAEGAGRLAKLGEHARLEVAPIAPGDRIPVDSLLAILRERGFRLVLFEGGPTLFGRLLAADAIDELFLTVAPQLVGRSEVAGRLGLVEAVGFPPALAPWARLRGVMRSGDHLFLRYALNHPERNGVS